MNRSRGKELAQGPQLEDAEQDLNGSSHHCDAERQLVGLHVRGGITPLREAESLDAAQHDHDHARGRSLDREFRVADRRREQPADDRCEDPRDRREAAG